MKCPQVAIIIRTFNEEKHIRKLLETCYAQISQYSFEIIIVDSGSTDRTLEIAKEFPVKLAHIKSDDFTYGRALNIGAENANALYGVCISAHCYPTNENWLDSLIKPLESSQVAMVYGRQVGDSRTKFSESEIFNHYFPEKKPSNQNIVFSNNANSAFKLKCWEKIAFDELLPGLEDIDWAKKVSEAGYDVVYSPESCVYHIHEETYAQVYKRYYREAVGLMTIYPQLKSNLLDVIREFFQFTLSDLASALKKKSLRKNFLSILCFRYHQYAGISSAYKNYGN